ncbi:Protein of unknown function DUF2778 [uncultured Caudovirales phage]|uniref:Tlde1 domain-containing protein n=1 Tax=uncultured Caudovirales phage TaxID=2100421 RepID=A0A6J5LM36_9CAUD|nr:Protein of unknown function DUF2778 [uncultured Caudovirales phage]
MTWTFIQASGKLLDPSGKYVATGYAGGNCGKNPEGVNNPAMQNISCVGPLPQGTYTLGVPKVSSKLGPFAIPLIPATQNKMFGRSAFFIHGDKASPPKSASEGCIILPRPIREQIYNSKDLTLVVV